MSMRVFREVVDRGTFVAAADRLNLSTATTSKHVMHMERRLGIRLLNRSSRSLSLTEPGRIYFERCKHILAELEQAESAVGSFGGAPRGTLRITCSSWLATRRMAEFLAAHRTRYPEVVIDLTFEDRFADIVVEGYDLALRSSVGAPPDGLIARPLPAVPLIIAGSTEYLRRHGTPRLPEELKHHDCVMVGNGHAWHFIGPNGAIEVPARVVARFRSASGVAHAVSAGIGLAPLPLTVIEEPQFKGMLNPILIDYPLRQPALFAVYLSRRFVPPKIRTFIEHLVEYMGEIALPVRPENSGIEAVSRHAAFGTAKWKVEPAPTVDSTQILPPRRSSTFLQIDSPIPVPVNSSRA
jgi:DNA-binding transcriptional LysR family regulator